MHEELRWLTEKLKSYPFIRIHSQKCLKITSYVINIEHTGQEEIGNIHVILEESKGERGPEEEEFSTSSLENHSALWDPADSSK